MAPLTPNFSEDGIVTTHVTDINDRGYSLAIDTDGNIVLAGEVSDSGVSDILVVRYEGYRPDDRFVDDDGSVFEADIEALARAGITAGWNPPLNDQYCPTKPVTRGQMAAFLVRALDLK